MDHLESYSSKTDEVHLMFQLVFCLNAHNLLSVILKQFDMNKNSNVVYIQMYDRVYPKMIIFLKENIKNL